MVPWKGTASAVPMAKKLGPRADAAQPPRHFPLATSDDIMGETASQLFLVF